MSPTPSEPDPHASAREEGLPGVRAFLAAGFLVAGGLLIGRAELLAQLALTRRGVTPEIADWAARAEWAPLFVQTLVMGVVAAAFAFGAGRGRRAFGVVLAGAVVFSALSGWPTASPAETLSLEGDGSELALRLGGAALGCGLALGILAALAEAKSGLRGLLESTAGIALCGIIGLGAPLYLTIAGAQEAPQMSVREVVREVVTGKQAFRFESTREGAPPRVGVLSPFKDIKLTSNEFDTGDKPAILMPPPCEVSFEVGEDEDLVQLVASAQIGYQISDRGFREYPGGAPSVLDNTGVESVAVRFEVLVDGEQIFDEVIRHRSGETGQQRVWRHVGGEIKPELEAGQRVHLRTSFADKETEDFYAAHPFDCGFGDLVLERWHEQPRRRANQDAPNLVVIVMDTLRADRMSCYGYAKPTTPNLDALAERGVLFESAFSSASWTWPSTASIFTGLMPYEHGVLSNTACNLNLSYETVAEVLQAQGYSTAAISCNPLINRATHFDQGFERFDEDVHMRMSDEVIDDVERTIDELADTRFYLYLQLVDPHTPHRPLESELERLGGEEPEDYPDRVRFGVLTDGLDHYAGVLDRAADDDAEGLPHPERVIPESHRRWLSDRYDASVGTGDHYVGRILDKLRDLGLDEKTIVVFTSDHGEELLDHDRLAHGHALWKELVHVPLIVAGPGLPVGQRIDTEVSNRQLAPTLAMLGGTELAGLQDPINLLAPELARSDIFYQTSKGAWKGHKHLDLLGRRSEDYVTHFAPKGGYFGKPPGDRGDARLFSILDDPLEQTDLIKVKSLIPTATSEVGALIESRKQQLERRRGIAIPVGADGRGLLAGVGYIESEGAQDEREREAGTQDQEDEE